MRYIRVMNYLEGLHTMAGHLLELESLFHGIFKVDLSLHKDKVTSIKRYQVLKIIEKEGPQNLTGLYRSFHMRKNSCSELLNRMIKDELVERTPSTEDRRKIFFHLTGRGKQLIRDFEKHFVKRVSMLFENLPGSEIMEFVRALEVIVAAAKKINI